MASVTDLDFLDNLLQEEKDPTIMTGRYPIPEQRGPLRQFEKEHRCASKGCGSPTHFKLQNIPRCSIHALRAMNDMLFDLGVEK